MLQILAILEDVVKAYGVQARSYDDTFSGLAAFDEGLRSRLFEHYDPSPLAESLRAIEPRAVYITEDSYCCNYCFLSIPINFHCYVIGPWLEISPDDALIDAMLRQNAIPPHLRPELVHYLNWVPLIATPGNWNAMLLTFAGHLYGGPDAFRLYHGGIDLRVSSVSYSPKPETDLSLQIIEDRYETENAMLRAVSEGDAKRALQYLFQYKGYTGEHRTEDPVRDRRNNHIVLNSLARKAVENGYVHPAHIHALSDDFARRIETISTTGEFTRLSKQMLSDYCGMVNKFSLRDFSPLIRNVINTIDFSLHEPLSLNFLAEKFNVNPSNLSTQFRLEKGVTLTSYINVKRMERAASLLRSSRLYVQEIAEQCGFIDTNYFARLFKRQYGLSPRSFRKESGRI